MSLLLLFVFEGLPYAAAVQMFGCYVKLKLSFVIYNQFELELQTTHRFS